MANIKHVNSIVNRDFRNRINQLIDIVNSVSELTIKNILTTEQFEELVIVLNGLARVGEIDSDALTEDLRMKIEALDKKVIDDVLGYVKENPELFKGDSSDKIHYLKVNGKDDFTAFQKISDNDYAASRFYKDTADEFLKGYENYILNKKVEVGEKTINENYSQITSGSMTYTTGTNHYTTQIGTIITHEFIGHTISFRSNTNSFGGMWKASIDGKEVKRISVFGNGTLKNVTIAENLSNTSHTLELEFIGQDPENPVSTPRGWIRFDEASDFKTFTILRTTIVDEEIRPANFTINFSNKEYAINVRDVDGTVSTEWFPSHSGIITTFKGADYVKELLVDGNKVSLEQASGNIAFKKAEFIQKVEHKLTGDTSARMECTFIVTFEDNKVYNDIKFKWLKDSEVTSGYVMQMPFNAEWFDFVVSDKFEQINKDTINTGTSTHFEDLTSKEFTGLSNNTDGKNYIYRMVINELSEPFKEIKLAHRDSSIQKLYPQNYLYTKKSAGTIDHVRGYYEYAVIPQANKVFKI